MSVGAPRRVLVLMVLVAVGVVGVVTSNEEVYNRPLSSQCPDTSRPSPLLTHNDVFLYRHDVTGDFPDIKRSSLDGGHGDGWQFSDQRDAPTHSARRDFSSPPQVLPGDDSPRDTERMEVTSRRSRGWLALLRPRTLQTAARNRVPPEADDTSLQQNIHGNKHRLSSGLDAQDEVINNDFPPLLHDSEPQTYHSLQLARLMKKDLPVDSPELSSIDAHLLLEGGTSFGLDGGQKIDRRFRELLALRDVVQTAVILDSQGLSSSQPPFRFRRSKGSNPLSLLQRASLSGSRFLTTHKEFDKRSAAKRTGPLGDSGRVTGQAREERTGDIPRVSSTSGNIVQGAASRQADPESPQSGHTDTVLNTILRCLGTDPSDLNEIPAGLDSHASSSSSSPSSNSPQTSGQEQQTLSDHDNDLLHDLTRGKRKVPSVSNGSENSQSKYAEVLKALSNLAQSAKVYKRTVLDNVSNQDHPLMTKKLSVIHPSCLNQKLDFLKSTANIDADILQFLTELTDVVAASTDMSEPSSPLSQEKRAQDETFKRNKPEPETFLQKKRKLRLDATPTSRLTAHTDVHQPTRSLSRVNGPHHGSPCDRVDKSSLPGNNKTHIDLNSSNNNSPTAPGETDTPNNNISNSSTAAAHMQTPNNNSSNNNNNSTAAGQTGTPGRISKRQAVSAERFTPGSALPWTCPSHTRWRDLGMHVFPRYVQETSCGARHSSHAHNVNNDGAATCWYGFYRCLPSTSAVQVLVRHTGTCNDSRVPQNMRRHYFLSIISISTGCNCV